MILWGSGTAVNPNPSSQPSSIIREIYKIFCTLTKKVLPIAPRPVQ
jgi:hypothetical protein